MDLLFQPDVTGLRERVSDHYSLMAQRTLLGGPPAKPRALRYAPGVDPRLADRDLWAEPPSPFGLLIDRQRDADRALLAWVRPLVHQFFIENPDAYSIDGYNLLLTSYLQP